MKKAGRISAFILALLMVPSLAACGTATDTDGTTNPAATTAKAATTVAGASETTAAGAAYEKPLTISFASIQIIEGRDYNEDEMSKWWRDKYNITWDIIPLTWENWAERLRIWVNSGDMPDMATWNYVHGEAVNYADQGLVKKFPDGWKDKWPNVAKAFEDTVLGPATEEVVGGAYYLPKPIFSSNKPTDRIISHLSLIMRKDWMEAVGFPVKDAYTTSELLEFARLVKEQDPGKVGDKLYPLNMRPSFAMQAFVKGNSTYYNTFIKGADGKYQWGPAQAETLAGLKIYQQAFREGLLNPEFFTLKDTQDYDSFYTTGQTGAIYSEGLAVVFQRDATQLKDNLGLDGEKVLHTAYLLGDDNKYHDMEALNYWTATIFSPKIDDEKYGRIMDMFDYAASDEGQLFIRMGFEGKDWKRDAAGELVSLLPEGKAITDVYPAQHPVYGKMVILSDDFGLINPATPKVWRDRTLSLYQQKYAAGDATTMPDFDFTVYFHDSPAMRKVAFDYQTEYASLIVKEGDLEANWKAWIAEKQPLIDPVLAELNAK